VAEEEKEKVEESVKKLLGLSEASKSVVKASAVIDHHEKLQRRYVPKSRQFLDQVSILLNCFFSCR
jgi:hypothetical protein